MGPVEKDGGKDRAGGLGFSFPWWFRPVRFALALAFPSLAAGVAAGRPNAAPCGSLGLGSPVRRRSGRRVPPAVGVSPVTAVPGRGGAWIFVCRLAIVRSRRVAS